MQLSHVSEPPCTNLLFPFSLQTVCWIQVRTLLWPLHHFHFIVLQSFGWYSMLRITVLLKGFSSVPVTPNIFTGSLVVVLGCFWTFCTKIFWSLALSTSRVPEQRHGCFYLNICVLLFVQMNVAPFNIWKFLPRRNQTCGNLWIYEGFGCL